MLRLKGKDRLLTKEAMEKDDSAKLAARDEHERQEFLKLAEKEAKEAMQAIDFSIVIPTRGRVSLLKDLLNDIKEQTFDLSRIEVIITIDFDDSVLNEYVALVKTIKELNCFLIIRERSLNLSNDYVNMMARLTRGKFIWSLNDDCIGLTKEWDKKFLEEIKGHKSKIFYVAIGGSGHKIDYRDGSFSSGFPILSREAYEAVGYFVYPSIRGYKGDSCLHSIFSHADAVIYLPATICINHRKGKSIWDETWRTMKRRGGRSISNIASDIERIKKAIEEEKKKSGKN